MNEHEKYVDLCVRILANCRNELYRYFPYLDGAFASLEYSPDEEILIGTDGEKLYFIQNTENVYCNVYSATVKEGRISAPELAFEKVYNVNTMVLEDGELL